MRVSANVMKRILKPLSVFILISFSVGICTAQHQETNIWYFGNHAGLDFNSGSPVAINGGQLVTLEGCFSISNSAGQLLFYSEGTTIWDRNHDTMPNGKNLWGHRSSTQSGIAVKDPGNNNRYYVFTAAAQANIGFAGQPHNGIAYSVVDMNLNGGLGDVDTTQKNIPLVGPATEKLTAVRHCNGTDVWVAAHKWNSNEFYVYQVSATGISAPVISSVGLVHQDVGSGQASETIGYMKFSADGKHLALACFSNMNVAQLFDFQNLTGVVSNPITLNLPPSSNQYNGPYGVSFSPDGSRLYVVWHDYPGSPNIIYQYDMTAGSDSLILASRTMVALTSSKNFGSLQLASNNKLYISNFSYQSSNFIGHPTLGCLNNPNLFGISCGWVPNAVNLDSGRSIWGLPGFIESKFYTYRLNIGNDTTVIEPFLMTLDADTGFQNYLWSTGDTTQTIQVSVVGTYSVSVTNSLGCTEIDYINITAGVGIESHALKADKIIAYFLGDRLIFSGDFGNVDKLNIQLFAIDGKKLLERNIFAVRSNEKREISIFLKAGVYLIRCMTKDFVLAKKVFKG